MLKSNKKSFFYKNIDSGATGPKPDRTEKIMIQVQKNFRFRSSRFRSGAAWTDEHPRLLPAQPLTMYNYINSI